MERFRRLLRFRRAAVSYCAHCGALLPAATREGGYCPLCRSMFNRAVLQPVPIPREPVAEVAPDNTAQVERGASVETTEPNVYQNAEPSGAHTSGLEVTEAGYTLTDAGSTQVDRAMVPMDAGGRPVSGVAASVEWSMPELEHLRSMLVEVRHQRDVLERELEALRQERAASTAERREWMALLREALKPR